MVKIITTTQELSTSRQSEKSPIGFVPTLGNLHAGHISLLAEALKQFKTVYFSIFVNPKQFGPNEDFNKYPRTIDDDLKLINDSLKAFPDRDIKVYIPKDPQEVFPKDYKETISVAGISEMLEGKIRPGHFDGVATVVYRLFELVKPDKAFFGLKDYQQYLLIRQMVKDLHIPTEVVGMPIIRDVTGLALSSRNQFLSSEEREQSKVLNLSLRRVKETLDGKLENIPKAKALIQEICKDKNWNYLEIRDAENLSSDINHSKNVSLLGVYQLRATRLLDNLQAELK